MLWLVGQIAVFLLIAVVLGLVIGWLLRTLWPSTRSRAREGELQTALERATSRISDLEAGLRAKRAASTAAAEQEQAALRRVEQLQAALDEANGRADGAREEQEQLRADIEAGKTSAEALRQRIADLEVQAATLSAVEASRDAARARAAAWEAELSGSTGPQRPLFAVPDAGEEARGGTEPDPEPSAEPLPEPRLEPIETPGDGQAPEKTDPTPESSKPSESPMETGEGEDGPAEETAEEETAEEEAARLEEERLEALAEAAERFALDEPTESDDLREIFGVGPALERLLHSMNIYTFAQIANFSDDDVDLVSRALGRSFPDRVTRDDWIGSARGLHRQKYGEEPPAP